MQGSALLLLLASAVPTPQQPRDARRVHTTPQPAYAESSSGLQNPALDGGVIEVEVADINGDGHNDLVSVGDHGSPFVNTQQHGVMVWIGNGRGDWNVVQVGNFGYGGVAAGDVDGDGLMDVGYGVHHNYSSVDLGDQLLEVALGDGSGGAWTAWDDGLATNGETWGMSATDFADVDEDGDLDVGSVSFGCCAGLHVYVNQGDGTWVQSFGFVGGNSASEFLFEDLDNDGHADIVAGHQSGVVYFGDGNGGFVAGSAGLPTVVGGMGGFDVGDLDGDGTLELAAARGGGVVVWKRGAEGWAPMSTRGLPASGRLQGVQLSDMNVDGHLDVVAFGRQDGIVFLGDGRGGFAAIPGFFTPPPGTLTTMRADRDVDHNGRPDVVLVTDEGGSFSSRNRLRCFTEISRPRRLEARITAPGPQRVLRAGSVRFVDWSSAVPAGQRTTVDLELSTTTPNGPWTPIGSALPDNGRYQWLVPPTPSNTCYLRITVTSATAFTRAVSARFRIL